MAAIIESDEPFFAGVPLIESAGAIVELLSLPDPDEESLILCADAIIAIAANSVVNRAMRFIPLCLPEIVLPPHAQLAWQGQLKLLLLVEKLRIKSHKTLTER
jgi:hypothetical protein